MPAFVIAMVNVTDPEKYSKYSAKATAASQKYGGTFLARGGEKKVMEGSVPFERVVINRFDTMEQAQKFYDSMEYQDAKQERLGAADFNMVVVQGV
jgi:uncharacterized protein (DUF1330 family)